jgi:hypothetical protein
MQPDGPARVLLAMIARHPEAVEDALEGGVAVFPARCYERKCRSDRQLQSLEPGAEWLA